MLDSNAYTITTGSLCGFFFFIFQKVVFLLPPSHKCHHKQTKIKFQITKFTLSDRIYLIECTYIRIEDILWPRQILRAVEVRAIWWGKEPCSFYVSVLKHFCDLLRRNLLCLIVKINSYKNEVKFKAILQFVNFLLDKSFYKYMWIGYHCALIDYYFVILLTTALHLLIYRYITSIKVYCSFTRNENITSNDNKSLKWRFKYSSELPNIFVQ